MVTHLLQLLPFSGVQAPGLQRGQEGPLQGEGGEREWLHLSISYTEILLKTSFNGVGPLLESHCFKFYLWIRFAPLETHIFDL